MIDPEWLSDQLRDVLHWQMAYPGNEDGPEIPWAGRRAWGIFLRLHEARGSNGFGPAAITYSDMYAFQRLTGEPLRPWEVEIIRALDSEFLKRAHEKTSEPETHVSKRPMSQGLFDALFVG